MRMHKDHAVTTNDADRAYTPGGPFPKELRGHVTLNISNDGLIYIADRDANRIQVTTKQGKFLNSVLSGIGVVPGIGLTGRLSLKYCFTTAADQFLRGTGHEQLPPGSSSISHLSKGVSCLRKSIH
jgi:hypothetical protein